MPGPLPGARHHPVTKSLHCPDIYIHIPTLHISISQSNISLNVNQGLTFHKSCSGPGHNYMYWYKIHITKFKLVVRKYLYLYTEFLAWGQIFLFIGDNSPGPGQKLWVNISWRQNNFINSCPCRYADMQVSLMHGQIEDYYSKFLVLPIFFILLIT